MTQESVIKDKILDKILQQKYDRNKAAAKKEIGPHHKELQWLKKEKQEATKKVQKIENKYGVASTTSAGKLEIKQLSRWYSKNVLPKKVVNNLNKARNLGDLGMVKERRKILNKLIKEYNLVEP